MLLLELKRLLAEQRAPRFQDVLHAFGRTSGLRLLGRVTSPQTVTLLRLYVIHSGLRADRPLRVDLRQVEGPVGWPANTASSSASLNPRGQSMIVMESVVSLSAILVLFPFNVEVPIPRR